MITLIDIGAAGGVQQRWAKIKNLRVVGFEPEKDAFDKLDVNSNKIMLNSALYKEKGSVDFHLLNNPTDSSILEPNMDFLGRFSGSERFANLKTIKIEVDTLDNQLKENKIDDVDFIKLDTQGSELLVLEGAKKSLELSFGIEIECEFQPLYKGQLLFSDIDIFLRQSGFHIFDIRNFYWKRRNGRFLGGDKGQVMYVEALYFKDLNSIPKNNQKIINAIEICKLYGYLDYALEILTSSKDILDTAEFNSINLQLKDHQSFGLPKYLRSHNLSELFKKLSKIFKPAMWKGVSWNDELGN